MKVKERDAVRAGLLALITESLIGMGKEEVGPVAGNAVMTPIVSETGEEGYAVITVTIPTGSKDGTPYDGHEAVAEYQRKQAEKAEKAAERERVKAEKAAKREAAKAEKEAGV